MLWLTIAATLAGGTAARAQPLAQPSHFYILQRTSPPAVAVRSLPAAARAPYERTLAIHAELATTAREPRSPERNRELKRLQQLEDEAYAQLEPELARAADELTPDGWWVYAEVRFRAAVSEFLDAADAAEAAGPHAEFPDPDFREAIRLYRYVAAIASGSIAAHARYLEGYCLLEHGRSAAASRAFRAAAPHVSGRLRAELLFRLGEEAFEEGRFDEAAGWYGRVEPVADETLHQLAVYKRVWSLSRLQRWAEAAAAYGTLPTNADAGIIDELASLLQQRP